MDICHHFIHAYPTAKLNGREGSGHCFFELVVQVYGVSAARTLQLDRLC